MLIPPKYTLTQEIVNLLNSIEASKEVIDSISIPPAVEQNIRRASTLRSSLYSARIEGNDLTLEDVQHRSSQDQKKAEVFNILKAINWINSRPKKDISLSEILSLHKEALNGLSPDAGKLRSQPSAIFNASGIAVYLSPPPRQIVPHLNRLIKYINSPKEHFTPIRASLAHFIFEKIHPFIDGNGRVGRLVMQKILHQGGYGMKGLLAIEEFLDNNRSAYYRALEEPEKAATDYVTFALEAISQTAKEAKALVLTKQESEEADFLLPRRAEIYQIIKDHKIINFDQLKRRFLKVNPRTLRYDLKKLQDQGLIIKLGGTNGVFYKPAKPTQKPASQQNYPK